MKVKNYGMYIEHSETKWDHFDVHYHHCRN